MCLKFPCVAGDDDGTPASHPAAKPPNGHPVHTPPAASGQLPSSAVNGASSHPVHTSPAAPGLLPSSETNGLSKPPAAAGEEPEKFDAAKTEGEKKSEKVTQGPAKAGKKPSSQTEKPDKKDDGAKNGRQDADARARTNQDHGRLPSVDVVGSQANTGTMYQDHEGRALSVNKPIREAGEYRFPHADDVGPLANPISRKDKPRRAARVY